LPSEEKKLQGPAGLANTDDDELEALEETTARLAQLDPPAPLPLAPEAEEAANVWFEQQPTSPDGPTVGPFARPQHASPAAVPNLPSADNIEAAGEGTAVIPTDLVARRPPGHQDWTLLSLVAAVALAVGMILGALIFGGGPTATATPGTTGGQACADGSAETTASDAATTNP
jgi:hypothetical protein